MKKLIVLAFCLFCSFGWSQDTETSIAVTCDVFMEENGRQKLKCGKAVYYLEQGTGVLDQETVWDDDNWVGPASSSPEVELLDKIVFQQDQQILALKQETQALRGELEQKNSIIKIKDEQIQEWKTIAGAKRTTKADKVRLFLGIGGSIASVLGFTLGR